MRDMTEGEKARAVVRAWRDAAPVLEAERRQRIRTGRPADLIPTFDGLLEAFFMREGYRTSSGLTTMQAIFRRNREGG
jgi:hypothetical protein